MRKLSIIHMPELFRLSIVKLETNGENGFPSLRLVPAAKVNVIEMITAVSVAFLYFHWKLFSICSWSVLGEENYSGELKEFRWTT